MAKKKKNKKNFKEVTSLLSVLLILIVLLVIFSFFYNMNKEEEFVINQIDQAEKDQANTKYDKIINNLNNNGHPKLELLVDENEKPEIIEINNSNIEDVKSSYSFLFNIDVLSNYGYLKAEIGDYLVQYDNALVVYDYAKNDVKSIFKIQNLQS